jgi:hypothetical protein
VDRRESLAAGLLRPRSVGEIFAGALGCYRRYPALFTELTLAVVLPYALVVVLVGGGGLLGDQHRGALSLLSVFLLDSLIVGPLISALHMHAVVMIREDQDPHVGDMLMRGLRVLPTVAAAQIAAALGVAVGFVLLIVPGVILAVRWAVVAQTAAVEKVNWIGALGRSRDLTRGAFWHVLGVVVIVIVVDLVLTQVGRAVIGSSAEWVQALIGVAVESIVLSFAALSTAVLFFDLLARSSGSLDATPRA